MTRHFEIELVISLSKARESEPRMIKEFPLLIGRFFCMLLKILLDIDDEFWRYICGFFHDGSVNK